MKVLLIADEEDKALYDYYDESKLRDVDLIISAGDLSSRYLEFLVTVGHAPVIYVPGNHDTYYETDPPLGCDCADDRIIDYHGLRILGLGGSMKYKDGAYMYTERDMEKRIDRLRGSIKLHNGFDILLTHAPAKGYGDMDDLPHRGFRCFNELMEKYHPKYMIHGHVHKTYGEFTRVRTHTSGTTIINAYGKYNLDLKKGDHPEEGKTGSFLYDLYKNVSMGKRQRLYYGSDGENK
ncbi:MAG: metallophosphoesterase family protein [Oribacterium sp.]|nr:metallophosphoesterase family protein [Oribacterium sp.]